MKRVLFLLLAMTLALSTCLGLVSCENTDQSGDKKPDAGNSDMGDGGESKPFSVDLAGYVANIGNATALGISSESKENTSEKASYNVYDIETGVPLSLSRRVTSRLSLMASYTSNGAYGSDIQFSEDFFDKGNGSLVENDSPVRTGKSYLVMSTVSYDANAPEADKTGLTKVTFTKIVTENVTTETTGTKYIVASAGAISIPATEGFTYTVYHNESLVYNEVRDNGASDTDAKVGVIVLDNLIDGTVYKVIYKGIGVETTLTQDEIGAEVEKMYVAGGYTFISFVPSALYRRPADEDLEYDYDGVAKYDKCDYFSNIARQSFVIDNATGYVYQIKDFPIDTVKDGLIISSGKYYDMSVADNGELNFIQVVRNETITVYNAFKDKYGNKYVQNDVLSAYDEENRTVYYTALNYILSQEGVAIRMQFVGEFSYTWMPEAFMSIEKINADFTSSPIDETEVYHFHYKPLNAQSTFLVSSITLSHIEDGYFYMYSTQEDAYCYYKRVHVSRPYLIDGNTPDETRLYVEDRSFGVWGGDGGNWSFNCLKSLPFDYDTVLIWCDWSGTEKLYYGDVWGENAFDQYYNAENFDESNLTVLLENCGCDPFWSFDLNKLRFRYTTFSGTVFYKIIADENGDPQAVNSETYVAPDAKVVTLQPINK